jgi:hypothetical protein
MPIVSHPSGPAIQGPKVSPCIRKMCDPLVQSWSPTIIEPLRMKTT